MRVRQPRRFLMQRLSCSSTMKARCLLHSSEGGETSLNGVQATYEVVFMVLNKQQQATEMLW